VLERILLKPVYRGYTVLISDEIKGKVIVPAESWITAALSAATFAARSVESSSN
jgi:hypothetical protein